MTRAVAGGCVLLALLDGYHHQFITFKEKGAPVDFVVPETMIKEPSGIWITKNTTRPHAAALFVDFLFSRARARGLPERQPASGPQRHGVELRWKKITAHSCHGCG